METQEHEPIDARPLRRGTQAFLCLVPSWEELGVGSASQNMCNSEI